jgi:hypothetical protein
LLSFLGSVGRRTDIPAHVFGFVCGVPFGSLWPKLGDGVVSSGRAQLLFGIAAVAVLVIAWAFSTHCSSRRSPD